MFRTSAGIVQTFLYHYKDRASRSTVNRQLPTAATVLTDRATSPILPHEWRSSVSAYAHLKPETGATLSLDRVAPVRSKTRVGWYTSGRSFPHEWPWCRTNTRSPNNPCHRNRYILTYLRTNVLQTWWSLTEAAQPDSCDLQIVDSIAAGLSRLWHNSQRCSLRQDHSALWRPSNIAWNQCAE